MVDTKKEQERDELHRAIWAIADELRGAVDGWDFKNYVLGTMFYRYISENLCNYINSGEIEAGNTDFDYAKNLCFSEGAVEMAMDAIRNGACIVTDTQMAKAGINKRALARYGGEAYCFMSDEDVAALAKKNGTTRATPSMDKAAEMDKKLIFAIGNAPTALVRLYELIENGKLSPELIIGVPVGFVNVVQSKELIMHADVPYIVAKGRKGGSNIAACIVNALLYMIDNRRD